MNGLRIPSVSCTAKTIILLFVLATASLTTVASDVGGLGNQVLGTYLVEFVIEGPLPPGLSSNFKCLMLLSETGSASGDCAVAPAGRDISAFYGVWKRTQGTRSFEILVFQFDKNETAFPVPDGTHLGTARVTNSVQFSEDFQEFEGSFTNEVFLSFQDPLGSDPPAGLILGTLSGRRIGN